MSMLRKKRAAGVAMLVVPTALLLAGCAPGTPPTDAPPTSAGPTDPQPTSPIIPPIVDPLAPLGCRWLYSPGDQQRHVDAGSALVDGAGPRLIERVDDAVFDLLTASLAHACGWTNEDGASVLVGELDAATQASLITALDATSEFDRIDDADGVLFTTTTVAIRVERGLWIAAASADEVDRRFAVVEAAAAPERRWAAATDCGDVIDPWTAAVYVGDGWVLQQSIVSPDDPRIPSPADATVCSASIVVGTDVFDSFAAGPTSRRAWADFAAVLDAQGFARERYRGGDLYVYNVDADAESIQMEIAYWFDDGEWVTFSLFHGSGVDTRIRDAVDWQVLRGLWAGVAA